MMFMNTDFIFFFFLSFENCKILKTYYYVYIYMFLIALFLMDGFRLLRNI